MAVKVYYNGRWVTIEDTSISDPIEAPPPAPDRPTRDSSRKSYPPRPYQKPGNTSTTRKDRQPSKTPYTRGWPRSSDEPGLFIRLMHWLNDFRDWGLQAVFTIICRRIMVIWAIWFIAHGDLLGIGITAWLILSFRLTDSPKPKNKTKHTDQQMTKLSDIFEGYEDDGHAFINLNITKKNDKE